MSSVERLGRAVQLYRRTASSRSAVLLVAANLIPIVGVVLFDWSLFTILVLYWLENGIVGFWNVPKIVLARGSLVPNLPDLPPAAAPAATWPSERAAQTTSGFAPPRAVGRLSAIPRAALATFFAFHYGMFWLVHGIFVFTLPLFAGDVVAGDLGPTDECFGPTGPVLACGAGGFGELVWSSVLIGGVALFLSHGASFVLNYLGRGEYLTASPSGQMGSAYGRVVVLHLTIIFGSMVVAFLGAPIAALLVLTVLKTALDLALHLRERRRSAPSLPRAFGGTAQPLPPPVS